MSAAPNVETVVTRLRGALERVHELEAALAEILVELVDPEPIEGGGAAPFGQAKAQ